MTLESGPIEAEDTAEDRVYTALGEIFRRGDEQALDLALDIGCQLAAFTADMAAVGQPRTLRRMAVNRLHYYRAETGRLVKDLEVALDQPTP